MSMDTEDPGDFSGTLVRVSGVDQAATLPPGTEGVFVSAPTAALFATLAARVPGLKHIITDGDTSEVTDAAVAHLAALESLETLDLEWSAVTDASLAVLARLPALQWVDLGSVAAVTAEGLDELRAARPGLEIDT